jgi:hypothetical protein
MALAAGIISQKFLSNPQLFIRQIQMSLLHHRAKKRMNRNLSFTVDGRRTCNAKKSASLHCRGETSAFFPTNDIVPLPQLERISLINKLKPSYIGTDTEWRVFDELGINLL